LAFENAVPSRAAAPGHVALIVGLPLLFLVLGTVIRYAAFAASTGETGFAAYAQGLCNWDCHWYVRIAEEGYDPFPTPQASNVGNWGFFPFYPMIVAAISTVVPAPVIQIAAVTSLVATYAAGLLGWPLLGGNMRAYALWCAFLLAGPFSAYFATFMTEPMFVLLTCCVLAALQRSNYLAAALFAALLSATRIVGVFIFFVIFLQMFLDHRRAGGTVLSFPGHLLGRPDLLFAIFLAPAGLFAYVLTLHLTVGDGLAFSHVQRAFGRAVAPPWQWLWDGLTKVPHTGWAPTSSQWNAIAAVAGLALSGWLAWRRRYGVALFCAICLVLPLSAGLASLVRYTVGLAPLGLAAMEILSARRALAWLAIALFLVGCYVFTAAWIGGHLALV
jgi:hypothetical protein